jgi:hypothetical protein
MRIWIVALLAIIAAPSFADAVEYQWSLEPTPPATGTELLLHLSSKPWGGSWLGPLPILRSLEIDPGVLRVFLDNPDYVEYLAQPLDITYSLGVVPLDATYVEIFACAEEAIPGYPPCGSDPLFVVGVGQLIFANSFE